MGVNVLKMSGVSRRYVSAVETVVAADSVDLVAHAGEFVCLFGASGSGKTTMLNLIAGLDTPDEGTIELAGQRVDQLDPEARVRLRRTVVGMVHQSDSLIEEFTAQENVALPLEAGGRDTKDALAEAADRLRVVGLDGLGDRFPRELSGGQRQRVGIARALTGGRAVLLADEPTGALDSTNSRAVYGILRKIADDGALVVIASHDLACREFATRSIEIVDGRITAEAAVG
jgi:ABC-type lipoprotein export system ATPase subunit